VYIETNDRYWECKVTFEKGEGKAEAWNVTGKRWDLHWTRKR
jgi:hypothetical protein